MAIVGTLPNILQNGTTADASQVMADFNFIANQVNANAVPIGTPQPGAFLGLQIFTVSGTYTPNASMKTVFFEVQGGGGGAGGCGAPGGGAVSLGTPGAAGTYAKGSFLAAAVGASQAVTIGVGGTGGSNANGTNGGQSSVGALIIAPGGAAGAVTNSLTPPTFGGNGNLSGAATGANVYSARGAGGTVCVALSATAAFGGNGGASQFGQGGAGPGINTNGTSAVNFGAGGSGIVLNSSGGTGTGGNGFQGIVLAWEYA